MTDLREPVVKHNHRMSGHFDFLDDDGVAHPNHELWGKTTTFPYNYRCVTVPKEVTIDGVTTLHNWWIITHTGINCRDARRQDGYLQWDNTNKDTPLTLDNLQTCKLHPDLPWMNRFCADVFRDPEYKGGMESIQMHEACEKSIPYRACIQQNVLPEEVLFKLGFGEGQWYKKSYPGNVFVAVRDDSLAWDIYEGKEHSPIMDYPYYYQISNRAWDDKIDTFLYETLPNRKATAERMHLAREEARRKILPLNTVPVPKLRTGRGVDNTGYVHAKLLNDLVHNYEALLLRQDSIVADIEAKTGEYGGRELKVWIEPATINGTSETTFGIHLDTNCIPIRAFDIRIDYPQGFEITSWIDQGLLPGALRIEKTLRGQLLLAQASKENADINGKIYDIGIKNIGAIPKSYEMPVTHAQFVDKDGKFVKQEVTLSKAILEVSK